MKQLLMEILKEENQEATLGKMKFFLAGKMKVLRNISSPSALASIKSRIQEVEVEKNNGRISPRPGRKTDVRDKPTRYKF